MAKIPVTDDLAINEHELEEKFIHSGGPGGQNVNKVATSVQLRFNVRNSRSLTPYVKERLQKLAGRRLTRDGVLVLVANRYRTQERNRENVRERLIALIAEASIPPPPKRRPTRPSKNARKKRMDTKVKRGAVKKLRGKVSGEE